MSDPVNEKEVEKALSCGESRSADWPEKVLAAEVRRLRKELAEWSLPRELVTARKLWHMDITLPPADGRTWQKNERIAIAADTLEEAVAKAREVYPTATFWKVNHGGKLHLEA